ALRSQEASPTWAGGDFRSAAGFESGAKSEGREQEPDDHVGGFLACPVSRISRVSPHAAGDAVVCLATSLPRRFSSTCQSQICTNLSSIGTNNQKKRPCGSARQNFATLAVPFRIPAETATLLRVRSTVAKEAS